MVEVDPQTFERGHRHSHLPSQFLARPLLSLLIAAVHRRLAAHRFVDFVLESANDRGGFGGIVRLQKALADFRMAVEEIVGHGGGNDLRQSIQLEHRRERSSKESLGAFFAGLRHESRLERFRRGVVLKAIVVAG